MSVGEGNLDGVLPYRLSGLRARLWFKHGQSRRLKRRGGIRQRFLLLSFIVACGAWAVVAQIHKVVMARVPVGPGNVHTRAAAHVYLHAGGLASQISRDRHLQCAFRRARQTGNAGACFTPRFDRLHRSRGREESDCRAGKFLDGRERSRCAGQVPA